MLDVRSGCITIGGIDIETIPRWRLRQEINLISQDEVFLPGSVAYNLRTLSRSSGEDAELENALQKVGLWALLCSRGGLDSELDPREFSRGQLQLFSLAVALLRKTEIVMIDEATSRYVRQEVRKFMVYADCANSQRGPRNG